MRWNTRVTRKLTEDGIIREEDIDIVEYGFACMVSNFIGIGVTFIMGSVFGDVLEAIILCCMVFSLRKCAGGFHADTRGKCFFLSTGLLLLSCLLFFKLSWTDYNYMIIVCISAGIIWNLSPIENENKRLDETERQVYRRRTRILLVSESLLFILSFLLGWAEMQRIIAMSLFIVGAVVVTGKMKTVRNQW